MNSTVNRPWSFRWPNTQVVWYGLIRFADLFKWNYLVLVMVQGMLGARGLWRGVTAGYKALGTDAKAYKGLIYNWILLTYVLNVGYSELCYVQRPAVEMVLVEMDSESEPVFEIEVFVSTYFSAWSSNCWWVFFCAGGKSADGQHV